MVVSRVLGNGKLDCGRQSCPGQWTVRFVVVSRVLENGKLDCRQSYPGQWKVRLWSSVVSWTMES